MTPTPITDLLVSVVGAETHRSGPARRRLAGGEWDAWYALTARQRRRLIGARWATATGMPPDEFADLIRRHRSDGDGRYDDALEWFYRTALQSIVERRYAANRDRHDRIARAGGDGTYARRRDRLAQESGHGTLWQYRKSRGWAENRAPRWRSTR